MLLNFEGKYIFKFIEGQKNTDVRLNKRKSAMRLETNLKKKLIYNVS